MALELLHQIINRAGGQSALAERMRDKLPTRSAFRQSHVWNWLNSPRKGQMPPADYLPALEAIASDLGLTISGRDLRPDIYPSSTSNAE